MFLGRKWLRVLVVLPLISFTYFAYLCYDWNRDDDWAGWRSVSEERVGHSLCVLIPFRNRETELAEFVPRMEEFLVRQRLPHVFIVLNQTDSFRFNRASLINVGWFEADRLGCDYIVMHDVDLLPLNDALNYSFPGQGVARHISSPEYHPMYKYTNFIGGVLMLTTADYKRVNGMSNKYWGWGLEDDEFFLRIRDAKLKLERSQGLKTDRSNTFRHIHGPERRRDYTRKSAATEAERRIKKKRDRAGGLSSVQYVIRERSGLHFGSAIVRILEIALMCNVSATPYCLQP